MDAMKFIEYLLKGMVASMSRIVPYACFVLAAFLYATQRNAKLD